MILLLAQGRFRIDLISTSISHNKQKKLYLETHWPTFKIRPQIEQKIFLNTTHNFLMIQMKSNLKKILP